MVQMVVGSSIVSHVEFGGPLPMVRFEEQGFVARSRGEIQALNAELVSSVEIAGNHVIRGFATQRDEELVSVSQLLAKHTRSGTSLQHLRRGPAPDGHHGHAHRGLELNLLSEAVLEVRHGRNQFESLA